MPRYAVAPRAMQGMPVCSATVSHSMAYGTLEPPTTRMRAPSVPRSVSCLTSTEPIRLPRYIAGSDCT